MNAITRPTLLLCLCLSSTVAVADDPPLELDEVREAVTTSLAKRKGDFANRLLTRGDATAVFDRLGQLGWNVRDQKSVVDRFLPDGDAVARLLRAKKNEAFAKKIAGYPNVYARLDQLRGMPYGMRRVQEFATTPGGHTMLQYMTTTKGGAELSKQLSRGKGGKGFGEPTGRLYTRKDLESELERLYQEEFGSGDAATKVPAKSPAGGNETESR